MVHTIFKFLILFWVSVCIVPTSADAYPVERNGADASISGTHTALAVVIGIGSLIGLVYALFNCSCCDESSLLKYEETPEDDDPAIVQEDDDFSPPTESTPAGEDKTPLEVTPVINLSAASGVDTSAVEPFNDPRLQFSRDQLNYLDEIGSGWFGKALRGEAEQIHPGMRKTRVVVKQLKDAATPDEQVLFLKEVQPYREVNHPNVLMLLGQCLETTPLLLVMEYAPNGDLKAFLGKNKDKMQSFAQDDVLLKMATDVISGLVWLHQKEFVHIDLAARNCQVCADNVVKIGDYGTSLEHYPDDYYMTKDQRHAVPIRWLSPEVINADQEDIEPKKITKQSNIWSFGVIMLEISTGAETPYPKLTDEEVLQKIVRERQIQLDKPNLAMKYADRWFETMAFCWLDEADRPNTKEVSDLVHHLNTYKDQLNQADFDSRWNALKPAAARESDPGMDIPQPQVPVIEEVISVTPESQQLSESPPQFEDEDEEFEPRAGEDPGIDIPQPQVPVVEEVVSVTPESQQLSESPPQFEDEDEFEPRADERDENQNDGSKMFHSEAGIAIAEPPAKPIRQQPEESPPEPHQFHGYAQVEKKKDSSGPKKLTITVSSGHKSKTLEIDNSPPKDGAATTAPVVVSPQPGGAEGHGDAPATLSFTIAGKKQEEEDPSQDDSPADEDTTNGHGVIDDGLEKDDDNIDRKRGKLHFSVVYSEQKQELQCMVHRAHNLKAMDPNGFSDPYVKLHILPRASSRSTKLRTKTKYKTLDPEFMEELTYHGIIADDLHTKTLRLSVWDEDSLGHNDFIGEYLLPLHKLPLNETKSYSIFLQDKSEEDEEISESERGKILLGLQYYQKTNQISVRIIRCAGLYAMDTNGYSDPYVKLYLQPDPKKKTKQKTATKKKTLNPEYMETFMYKLPPEDIHTKTLEVTVWDKDVGSNDYIGGVQLGSTTRGDRRQHWTDAIENPDQMIERWHLLSETQFTEDD